MDNPLLPSHGETLNQNMALPIRTLGLDKTVNIITPSGSNGAYFFKKMMMGLGNLWSLWSVYCGHIKVVS